jgi:3-methyladenine DNA glycosylase AlkD
MVEHQQSNILLSQLITHIKSLLEKRRYDERAKEMAHYTKGKFHFFGINSPNRKQIQQLWFKELKNTDCYGFRWSC